MATNESYSCHQRLAELLTYPYFWTPKTICSFFVEGAELLKKYNEAKIGKEFRKMVDGLDTKAAENHVVGPGGNWQEILDIKNHVEVLLKGTKGADIFRKNVTSIKFLLKVCRNKRIHFDTLSNDDRKQLNLLSVLAKNTTEYVYANHWTQLYPDLVPFFWSEYSPFRNNQPSIQEFYSSTSSTGYAFIPLDQVLSKVQEEILEDVYAGGLTEYFLSTTKNMNLEFRSMPSNYLSRLLLKNSNALFISISKDKIHVTNGDITPLAHNILTGSSSFDGLVNTCIIIIDDCTKLDAEVFDSIKSSTKVILYTHKKRIPNCKKRVIPIAETLFHTKFERKVVDWEFLVNLSESKSLQVIHKLVSVQGKERSFDEILSIDESVTKKMLSKLDSETIELLLTNNKPCFFESCKLPPSDSIYINRKILKRVEVSTVILSSGNEPITEIFLICGVKLTKFNEVFQNKNLKSVEIKREQDKPNIKFPTEVDTPILVIENIIENIFEVEEPLALLPWYHNKNVHCLQYESERTLVWLGTTNKNTTYLKKFINTSIYDCQIFDEDSLLKNLSSKLMIVHDLPGMGKTTVLKKLAEKLLNMNCFVVVVQLVDFVHKIESIQPPPKTIFDVVSKIICTSVIETEILKMWITEGTFMFDIFFDGLDQVNLEIRNEFLNFIRQIVSFHSNLRIWIAMRNHIDRCEFANLSACFFKLIPFDKREQTRFLIDLWCQGSEKVLDMRNSESLKLFAEKCISTWIADQYVGIAGIPLQCYIISQIYLEKVIRIVMGKESVNGDFNNWGQNIFRLYESLVEAKFRLYLKNNGCTLSNMKNHHIELTRQSMQDGHLYFALKLIFSDGIANWFRDTFNRVVLDTKEYFEYILSYGLIQSFQPLQFVHRTIAEHFIAVFVVQSILKKSKLVRNKEFQDIVWKNILKLDTNPKIKSNPKTKSNPNQLQIQELSNSRRYNEHSHFLYSTKFMHSVIGNFVELGLRENLESSENFTVKRNVHTTEFVFEIDSLSCITGWEFAELENFNKQGFGKMFQVLVSYDNPPDNWPPGALFVAAALVGQTEYTQYLLPYEIDRLCCKETFSTNIVKWVFATFGYGLRNQIQFIPTLQLLEFMQGPLKQHKPESFHLNKIDLYHTDIDNEIFIFKVKPKPDSNNDALFQICECGGYSFKSVFLHTLREILSYSLMRVSRLYPKSPNSVLESRNFVLDWFQYFATELGLTNLQNEFGQSLLHIVAEKIIHFCKIEIQFDLCTQLWKYLVSKNYNSALVDNFGNTPFHLAMQQSKSHKVVSFFAHELRDNCSQAVTTQNADGNSPLLLSLGSRVCDVDIISTLVEAGADVNLGNNAGVTPMLAAAQLGEKNIIKFLKSKEAEINAFDKNGENVLFFAARSHIVENLEYFWEQNPNFSCQSKKNGKSLLHVVVNACTDRTDHPQCPAGRLAVVRYILDRVNVNLQDKNGNTALHLATQTDRLDDVKLLLAKNPDIFKLNNSKECPIFVALKYFNYNVLETLINAEEHILVQASCACELHQFLSHNKTEVSGIVEELKTNNYLKCKDCKLTYIFNCSCFLKRFALIYQLCYQLKDKEKFLPHNPLETYIEQWCRINGIVLAHNILVFLDQSLKTRGQFKGYQLFLVLRYFD